MMMMNSSCMILDEEEEGLGVGGWRLTCLVCKGNLAGLRQIETKQRTPYWRWCQCGFIIQYIDDYA